MRKIMIDARKIVLFKELVQQVCGFALEMGREQTLVDGLRRRMSSLGIDEPEIYYQVLLSDQGELNELVEILTVNETYFFREPEHLNFLVSKLVPDIVACSGKRPLRILSAGCSTGEEPYSIAIMLRERYGAESEKLFSITGVDIDSKAISEARNGIYGQNSFRGMERMMIDRYFDQISPGRYRVNETVRRQPFFCVANLLAERYPPEMLQPDLILYRNVSIYFPKDVQRKIFGRLAALLETGGHLIVSATETIHHDLGILSLEQHGSIYYYTKKPVFLFEERRRRDYGAAARVPDIESGKKRSDLSRRGVELPERMRAAGSGEEVKTGRSDKSFSDENIKAMFENAFALAQKGLHEEAIKALEEIAWEELFFPKAALLKGALLYRESDFDGSGRVCNSIVAKDPLCLEAYLLLGMISWQKRDNDEALKRFREAVYLNQECWAAHFYTAEILSARNDEKRALSSYEAALRILEKGDIKGVGKVFFPLAFNAEQFLVVCRHKLSVMKRGRDGV